jgi:hypothetical protein
VVGFYTDCLLTFSPFLADFSIFEKEGKNGLTLRPFLESFAIFHKCAKNSKKVRLYSLYFSSIFSDFCHFS